MSAFLGGRWQLPKRIRAVDIHWKADSGTVWAVYEQPRKWWQFWQPRSVWHYEPIRHDCERFTFVENNDELAAE